MEKTVVKFSRPLLFRESINGKYYLGYGFIVDDDKLDGPDDPILYDYIGYLAGMHFFASGADYIDVNYDCGIPVWMDKNGHPHFQKDHWMAQRMEKCRELLGLTYEVIRMEIDESVLESNFIIKDEKFFDRLDEQGVEQGDDLPF